MSTDETAPAHVTALAAALQPLLDEAEALRSDVHAAEAARRLSAKFNLGMLALVTVGLIAVLSIGWQNNRLAHQVNQTNNQMADCTTPGGSCYEQGTARTGQAIANIIRAEVYMAECARLYPNEAGPAYDKKLEACVYARLAAPASAAPKAGG